MLGKIWLAIMTALTSVKHFWKTAILPAIEVVELIKKAVDSPGADFLVSLTKTQWDDNLLKKIREALAYAVQYLELSKECLSKTDPAEAIKCLITYIRSLPVSQRGMHFHQLASIIAQKLSEDSHPLTPHEADTFTQIAYAKLRRDAGDNTTGKSAPVPVTPIVAQSRDVNTGSVAATASTASLNGQAKTSKSKGSNQKKA